MTTSIGVGVPRNHFLFHSLERTMQLIIPAGIPQYLWTFHYDTFFKIHKYKKIRKKVPKVLSVDDLSFGFVVWLFVCGIAVTCFLSEMVYFYFLKEFFGFNVFFRILSMRIKNSVYN